MYKKNKKKLDRKYIILIVLAYLFLTLVLTIPVVFQMNTHIAGGHDSFETYAGIYKDKLKITTGEESFSSSLLKGNIIKKLFNFRTYINLIHTIAEEPFAYNLVWLLSFFLAAIGTYFLCYYFTRNSIASFLAGIIYAFSPLHFGYAMAFGGGTHIEFIPFFVLFLFKYLKSLKVKYLLFLTIFFLFIIINEPHFAAYTFLFIILVLIYFFYKKKLYKNKKFQKQIIGAVILTITLLIIFYWPLIKVAISEQNYLNPGLKQTIHFSNDVVALVTPGFLHPLWGDYFQNTVMKNFTGNASEWSIYIGIVGLFFLTFSFFIMKKNNHLSFWIFVFFFFFIISLGPFLHFLGTIEPKIPLPYLAIYEYIPFFENIRSVGRAFIYASLAIALILGFGLTVILNKLKSRPKISKLIYFVIFSLVIIEFWSVPTSRSVEVPEIYKKIANDKEEYVILQPRITSSHGIASMSRYYNTIANKKVIGGFHFARENPDLYTFEKTTPVINTLLYALPYGYPTSSFITQDYSKISNVVLNKNNIKYIILSKEFIDVDITLTNWIRIKKFIENNINVEKVIDDKYTITYYVKQPSNEKILIMQEGNGWSKTRQLNTGEFVADANDQNPEFSIYNYSDQAKNINLTLQVRSNINNRKILLSYNDQSIGPYAINYEKTGIHLLLKNISPGKSTLKFNFLNNDQQKIKITDVDTFTISARYQETDMEINRPNFYQQIIDDNNNFNIIQAPNVYYGFTEKSLGDKKIFGINSEFNELECQALNLMNYVKYDDIKASLEDMDFNLQKKINQTCITNNQIKYIVLNKKFLQPDEYSNIISYIISLIPNKKMIVNDNELLVYELSITNEQEPVYYYENFEQSNLYTWHQIGSNNDITISNEPHSGQQSVQISFQPKQNFNGIARYFDSAKTTARAEAWIKINSWAGGFTSLYFDFIKNYQLLYDPKLIVDDTYYLYDNFIGHLYHNGEFITYGHNFPNNEWVKLKIDLDKTGTLHFYQNDIEIQTIPNYGNNPIFGFRIGVGGCCPESNIEILVDDVRLTY